MTNYIVPCLIAFILIYGLVNKVDVFDEFLAGAKEGLLTCVKIIPALVGLMTCVGMFKVSGGLDVISHSLSPIARIFKIPKEIIPLALLRPISGSGALVIFQDLLASYGADSHIAKVASVLMGSSETTFYTLAIYFGAVRTKFTRHTLVCSVLGDIVGFIMSSLLVYIIFK